MLFELKIKPKNYIIKQNSKREKTDNIIYKDESEESDITYV